MYTISDLYVEFMANPTEVELQFPPSVTDSQRLMLHKKCRQFKARYGNGFKTQSKETPNGRCLSIIYKPLQEKQWELRDHQRDLEGMEI